MRFDEVGVSRATFRPSIVHAAVAARAATFILPACSSSTT
jgi:hypothetical protein